MPARTAILALQNEPAPLHSRCRRSGPTRTPSRGIPATLQGPHAMCPGPVIHLGFQPKCSAASDPEFDGQRHVEPIDQHRKSLGKRNCDAEIHPCLDECAPGRGHRGISLECLVLSSEWGRERIAAHGNLPARRYSGSRFDTAREDRGCSGSSLHFQPKRRGNARHPKESFHPTWKNNHRTMVNAAAGTTGPEAEIAIARTTGETSVPPVIAPAAAIETREAAIAPAGERSPRRRSGRSSSPPSLSDFLGSRSGNRPGNPS